MGLLVILEKYKYRGFFVFGGKYRIKMIMRKMFTILLLETTVETHIMCDFDIWEICEDLQFD